MDERYIASLDLLAVHPAVHRTPVSLRVGAPERAPEGEWLCAMRLDDLFEELVPMRGEDSVQALCPVQGMCRIPDLVGSVPAPDHPPTSEHANLSAGEWCLEPRPSLRKHSRGARVLPCLPLFDLHL